MILLRRLLKVGICPVCKREVESYGYLIELTVIGERGTADTIACSECLPHVLPSWAEQGIESTRKWAKKNK